MKLTADFKGLADNVRAVATMYSKQFSAETQKHDAKVKVIKERTAPRFVAEETRKADAEYAEQMNSARHDAKHTLENDFIGIRAKVDASVLTFPSSDIMAKLTAVENVHMTKAEFAAVARNFANDRYSNYWVNKRLQSIAERFGIDYSNIADLDISTNYDGQKQALDSLEAAFNGFIDGYAGDKTTYSVNSSMSDKNILRLEQQFYGAKNPHYSDSQYADRAVAVVASAPDVISLSLGVRNMLDGVEGSRREYILDELSHNDRVRSAIMALPHDLQQEIKSFDSEAFHNRLKQQKEKAAADKDKKLNDAFIDLPADIQNKARLNAVARKSEKVGRVLTDAEANSVTISSEDINKALNDDYSASHVSD